MQELEESQRLVTAIHSRLEDPKVLEKVLKKARVTQTGEATTNSPGVDSELLQHLSNPVHKAAVRRGSGL